MTADVRVACIAKGAERYVYLWLDDEPGRQAIVRVLGRHAADPELSFTWYDAARLCKSVREHPRHDVGEHEPPPDREDVIGRLRRG